MSNLIGQQLGNYRLVRLIGEDSWASLYLGEHLHLNTQAAIKVMHARLTDEDSERLRTEARLIARLLHPHIVRILDFGVEDGTPFLVMEYASNGSLRQRHPKGTQVPVETVVSYVKQVADALYYTHQQKLIHRDVKPESMVLGHKNEVLLTDFTLAIIAQSTRSQQTQEAAGSVTYMAPEQLRGKPRPASDQYALATVVYEWLSGEPPFSGSVRQIANQHLSVPPPSLRAKAPTISPSLEQVVLKALAKEAGQRFANVQDFALAFEGAYRAELSEQALHVPSTEHADDSRPGRSDRSATQHLPTGTVTLLFTDIEGSARLLQQSVEQYTDLLAECRHLLRASFQEWNGYELATLGDAFFAAFARATDAVLAAVEVQRALASHPWPQDKAVRVRMGIHTGEPTRTAEGYVGLDMYRAARVMNAAHGGQVLLSQTTSSLVEQDLPDDVSLRDLGEHRLKDLGRHRHLFQLVISGLPADFPRLKTLDASPNNLPAQFTPFIGREQELAAVQELLHREEVRLLTLTGAGGAGKTRLSLQVAAELSDSFADGVFFVNLAPISDPAFVIPTIAQTLDIHVGNGQSWQARLREELQAKQMLLLLDNFEQVVSAGVEVVDLLAACPGLKMLVTSREALHVRGEHEFAVPPLALPDPRHLPDLAALTHNAAVALFLQRAQAVKPDFQLTNANARAIVEICVRLDGLPLAIELAAARVKLLPPQALLARLNQRLSLLTGASRDIPVRQQALRNTIAWSYNLLDAAEQRLFRRLSVFVGGCTLQAIEAVCAALDNDEEAEPVIERVASLIDKSLLQQIEQEGEEPRLLMLETIREYGLERLKANGEMKAVQQAHAAYYLKLAEEAEPELISPQQAVWLERLEQEHDNLRATMSWLLEQGTSVASTEMALRLSSALEEFWYMRGHHNEGQAFLKEALARSGKVSPEVRRRALYATGDMAMCAGDLDQAQLLFEEGLRLSQEAGDTARIALFLYGLGWVSWSRREYIMAQSLAEEALAFWRKMGDREHIAWTLHLLASLADQQGEYARTRTLCEEMVRIHRESGNQSGLAHALCELAEVLFVSQSDPATVHLLLNESQAISQELGDKSVMADCFSLAGRLALYQGDAMTARSLIEQGLALYRETEFRLEGISQSLSLLGKVAATQGNYTAARDYYEEGLALQKSMDTIWAASSMEGLANAVAAQGELVWAARLYGAAAALRERKDIHFPPIERATYEDSVATIRKQLGEQAFATAWAEGRRMTPEQALAAQGSAIAPVSIPAEPPPTPPATPPAIPLPTYPDDLTAREVEVLRLLAQGWTDAQIAEQLVISPRTVNNHLTSIYRKIQVSSRSAATRYALEHHLV